MRRYAFLKSPIDRGRDQYIYKIMLYHSDEGTYLFEYSSPDAVQCSADVFYESVEDLYEEWDELIDERGWIDMEDPLPDCQQDAFIPLRVKGRNEGKPEWGKFETLKDGCWVTYQPEQTPQEEKATTYKIRIAGPSDEGRIRELFVEMLRTILRKDEVEGYKSGYLDKFWNGGEDRVYVAEDGIVVGFLSVEVHHEEQEYVYLDDFSVTAAYRNKGIGGELLQAAETYARELGMPAVVLHVEKTNEAAFRFYERAGYAIYRDDGNRYLLSKEL